VNAAFEVSRWSFESLVACNVDLRGPDIEVGVINVIDELSVAVEFERALAIEGGGERSALSDVYV